MNRQERQISAPGPNGTPTLKLGVPVSDTVGTAFSETSLSPARISYRMSISTSDTPPTKRLAPAACQCNEPKKATHLTTIPTEQGQISTSPAAVCAAGRATHSPNPYARLSMQKGMVPHSMHQLTPLGRAPADQTNRSGAIPSPSS